MLLFQVAYLFAADLANSIFIYVYVYRALIVHFGNLSHVGVHSIDLTTFIDIHRQF
jgi:hypothetical protein